MPTKRTRKSRNIVATVSPGGIWAMSDERLYPKPADLNEWELDFVPGYRNPTTQRDEKCRAAWDECKADIMRDWIAKFPGTRPKYWWLFDAPRMPAAEIARRGWTGWYYVAWLCEPRERLGGTGTPAYELECVTPYFELGIPDDFRNVDRDNPPTFESQAAYLRRHGLFEPGEERRLKARDLEPEVIPLDPVGPGAVVPFSIQ